jgi:hypothetical protein
MPVMSFARVAFDQAWSRRQPQLSSGGLLANDFNWQVTPQKDILNATWPMDANRTTMKLFISWSGESSALVAEALRTSLANVFDGVEPWMSKRDLEPGMKWGSRLAEELAGTDFGIICVTADNVDSSWINFEAGCLAKIDESRVIPFLIDLEKRSLRGPLSHFQAELSNQAGTRRLFEAIRRVIKKPSEEEFEQRFNRAWSRLEKELAKAISGKRIDPESGVALSLCHLLLERGYIKEVAERVATPRHSRGLPGEWLTMASITARLTGNQNTARLLRELSALDGSLGEIAQYENALLHYGRGFSRQAIMGIVGNFTFREKSLAIAYNVLLRLCALEEKLQDYEVPLPCIGAKPAKVDPYYVYCATQIAIIAAAEGKVEKAETFFDIARTIPNVAGSRVSGYPFVQLIAPPERLLADVIANTVEDKLGINALEEEIVLQALKQPSIANVRGHLHITSRYANTLLSSNRALNSLESLSQKWKYVKKLEKDAVRERLLLLRACIPKMAGNP